MANVYEIIDMLREGKYMSMRGLARLAGISSTTMASTMARKPKDVSVKFLEKVAKVFGVQWYDFYGDAPETYTKYNDDRVSSFVSDNAKEKFLHKMLGSDYYAMQEHKNEENYRLIEQVMNKHELSVDSLPHEKAAYECFLKLLKELNQDGVQYIFNQILEALKNENYRKKE